MFRVSPMVLPSTEELADSGAVPSGALRALVDAVHSADFGSSRDALEAFAAVTVEICAAVAAVVRLVDRDGTGLTAHAVHATSPSSPPSCAGSRVEVGQDVSSSRLEFAFSAPIELDGELAGSLEVLRETSPFSEGERLLAQLAAGGLALVLRALASRPAENESAVERALVLAGEALAAGTDHERGAQHVARLAADAAEAQAAVLWQTDHGEPTLAASFGESPAAESAALSAARVALDSRSFLIRRANRRRGRPERPSRRAARRRAPARLRGRSGRERRSRVSTTFALRAAQTLRAGDSAR